MRNEEVSRVFDRIADLLEIKGESIYRVLAYRRATEEIRSYARDIEEVWKAGELKQIPGVGEAIAEKIDELFRTGKLDYYENLKREIPESLADLLQVGGVGPKKAARFWKELGITTREGLEDAARQGRLRSMEGMGEKSETRILESLAALRRRETGRIPLGRARESAARLLARLRSLPGVERAEAAGSLRRWRETVGDLDFVVAATRSESVRRAIVEWSDIVRVLGQGETKVSLELQEGLRLQLWVHPPERFGSAWQYATGSQAHSVRLRELALDQGLSLSEHGFKRTNGKEILCASEEQVYATLGLPWIPPELREDRGEFEAARAGRLPGLVQESDLRGELHSHTLWSDGAADIRALAEAAQAMGLEYLVITDHSKSLGMVQGLDEARVREQRAEVRAIQKSVGPALRILHGAEVEILADGSLDFPDSVLADLDLVVASVHTSLRQPRAQMTERVVRALANSHVDVLGHPTGRLLGKRDPSDLDMEAVFRAAAEHQVALEVNCHPERLDLNDIQARAALDLGCMLALDTDAHHPDHLRLREYGVGMARRAWAEKRSVVNTWPLADLETWLDRRKDPVRRDRG